MAHFRPFAITQTPLSIPDGTINIDNIVVGVDNQNYDGLGGLDWFAGPDEDLGYIIAAYNTNNNQPTQFPVDNLYLNPDAAGFNIILSNSDTTASQAGGGVNSVLALSAIGGSNIMFSVKYTNSNPTPGISYIGIGNSAIKLNNFIGNNNAGIGFSSDGNFWFNNTSQPGSPTWVNGDIIDIAVSPTLDACWIRVNGGNWNNSPTSNLSTGVYGISLYDINVDGTDIYPGLCPELGVMTIQSNSKYNVPDNYNFLGNKNVNIKFLRCAKNDSAFIALAQTLVEVIPATVPNALQMLNDNGYWTSYGKSYWTFGYQP